MKHVILSTDGTREYYELLPLVCYSWQKLGYNPIVLTVGSVPDAVRCFSGANCFDFPEAEGVRDSTIAQLSRLFVVPEIFGDANLIKDDIFITSDADMVIAKDIFNCSDGFTNYGYDLTGRSELPICYNIAKTNVWRELMGEFTIPPKAYSDKWEDYWSVDQQLLTQRAHEYGMGKITFVDRGNNNKHGLPTSRWDRHDWAHVPDDIIDVHMLRNSWDAQIQVFQRLWPGEDYSFILKFKDELARNIG